MILTSSNLLLMKSMGRV